MKISGGRSEGHSAGSSGLDRISADARVEVRRSGPPDPEGKCVVYWMQRAQRGIDNPALDVAVEVANELQLPVVTFFAPVPFYPHANLRHYRFLQEGVADIAAALEPRGVGFVLRPFPQHSLISFCTEMRAAMVIGDENPLRETEAWRQKAAKGLRVPLWTVDADVIVPTGLMNKEHFAARTIRPRINERLKEFMVAPRNLKAAKKWAGKGVRSEDVREDFTAKWKIDRSVAPVTFLQGGTKRGLAALQQFLTSGLGEYDEARNKPELEGTSRLSPYLHFGHLGPHTVALAVQKTRANEASKAAFLEQLIVRRELAINFVRFNPVYDSIESAEPWAQRTLAEHARDERPVRYSEKQMENAESHDPLWNAAQLQMTAGGWMHNYMRMYWAKKILEWSADPAAAYRLAVRLNDKYFLDGRDPNGYAGVAWAIAGKHDRPWFKRPIFGTIRYMSYASTSKKFDSKAYIRMVEQMAGRSQQMELL